jgi:hypothetical protein
MEAGSGAGSAVWVALFYGLGMPVLQILLIFASSYDQSYATTLLAAQDVARADGGLRVNSG